MKKSDLESGMVVKFKKDKNNYVLIGDIFCEVDGYGYLPLDNFDNDMKSNMTASYDIDSVYRCKFNNKISSAKNNELELIWKRKDEIDWRNVKFGTKVRCWDNGDSLVYEGLFLEYVSEDEDFPFRVYSEDIKDEVLWECCELA